MAKSIALVSGSLFCDNPVIVEIVSENAGENVTFHRVILEVRAALSTDNKFVDYRCSVIAENSETVSLDISSVLRSVSKRFVYEPILADKTFPYIVYELKAYDEYMRAGVLYSKQGERSGGGRFYSFIGGFSDVERLLAGNTKDIERFSKKPTFGEVCSASELLVLPAHVSTPLRIGDTISSGPTVNVHSLSGLNGLHSFSGHFVYVLPESSASRRVSFQFVNSLGVLESISAEMRKKVSYEMTTERYTVTVPSGFKPNGRLTSHKGKPEQVLGLNSGVLNKEWADWWVNEFLACTRGSWIHWEGVWLPCEVIPEENVSLYDESKNELINVSFTVRFSLYGGFRNRL